MAVADRGLAPHRNKLLMPSSAWRRSLLLGGVAATVLYVGLDALASILYDGYNYTDQTISELSAVGAPTRDLWIPLGVVYSLLTIACGYGVWLAAGRSRAVRAVGAFIFVIGVLGLVAWPLAPMHQREVLAADRGTFSDTLHLILGGIDTLLFALSIALGATAFGRRFRAYSIGTFLVIMIAGAFTGLQGGKVADNASTPWIGITERIAVFGSMVWISVLAWTLWRRQDTDEPEAS